MERQLRGYGYGRKTEIDNNDKW